MNSLIISQILFLLLAIILLPDTSAFRVAPLFRTKVFGYGPEPATTSSPTTKVLKTYFYNQTIDHFTYSPESYRLFTQRYYVNDANWGGGNSPIFVYLGDEQSLDLYDVTDVSIGFLEEHAPKFKALTVYIEHRFYGRSNPLGSMAASMKNPKVRGYLNSAQALADYAEIILDLRKRYAAPHSPIIVFGVSYGGMLASWFRLKYPHVALGALASSAPILKHVVSNDAYLRVVTQDFKDTSENCYKTIKESWKQIKKLGSRSNGIKILNKKLNTCSSLSMDSIVDDFLFPIYTTAAQYDFPPWYPVASICKGIDSAPKTADAIDKVYSGLVSLFYNTSSCFTGLEASQIPTTSSTESAVDDTSLGWPWQTCSEMVHFASVSVSSNDTGTMFPFIQPFDLEENLRSCQATYGVPPRPNWVQTYYGGQDIKLVLQRFGSNIIFSNGLRDPYSASGVLENLSDTLLAIHTPLGAHGLDMFGAFKDDPKWLITMRKKEVETIQGWITQYYSDLSAYENQSGQ